eukprot:scaffold421352_cov51-Attheya_sp.AAC.1
MTWCLSVSMTFESAEKVEKARKTLNEYASYIEKNEPNTLGYQVYTSDKDPLRIMIMERYPDIADLDVHRESDMFKKVRPVLADLNPVIEGHSYFEPSDGGFLMRQGEFGSSHFSDLTGQGIIYAALVGLVWFFWRSNAFRRKERLAR